MKVLDVILDVTRTMQPKETSELLNAIREIRESGECSPVSNRTVALAINMVRPYIKTKGKRGNPKFKMGKSNPYYDKKDNSDNYLSELCQKRKKDKKDNYLCQLSFGGENQAEEEQKTAIEGRRDNSDNNNVNYLLGDCQKSEILPSPPFPPSAPLDGFPSSFPPTPPISTTLPINPPIIPPTPPLPDQPNKDEYVDIFGNNSTELSIKQYARLSEIYPGFDDYDEEIKKKIIRFYNRLAPYVNEFGKEMVLDFFLTWAEISDGGKMMRFEKQETFNIKKRLVTWKKNAEKYSKEKNNKTKQFNRGTQGIVDQQREILAQIAKEVREEYSPHRN